MSAPSPPPLEDRSRRRPMVYVAMPAACWIDASVTQPAYMLTAGLILCILVLAGCGDGRPPRVPVRGQVVIDQIPLTGGAVRFFPEKGRPSTGEIDSQGRFSLFTFEPGDGCTLGVHRVAVIAVEEVNATTRRWNTPKHYASPGTSDITQTIDDPTDSMVIELTWGTEKGPIIEKFYGE